MPDPPPSIALSISCISFNLKKYHIAFSMGSILEAIRFKFGPLGIPGGALGGLMLGKIEALGYDVCCERIQECLEGQGPLQQGIRTPN